MINIGRLGWLLGIIIGTFIYQGLIVDDWIAAGVNSVLLIIFTLGSFWIADKNPVVKKPLFVKENDLSS